MCLPIDAGPSRQPDAMSTISLLSSVCRKHAVIFAPAMVVWPVWAYTMQVHGVWHEVFSNYWSMSVAMVIGSFVAGSTPLGGGVVAYPISQLVLRWPTPDSRDASILVQSIGMNAAGYLLCVHKRELLDSRFIFVFTVFGGIGVLFGLTVASPSGIGPTEWPPGTLPSGLANILFGSLVLLFAIAYCYTADVLPRYKMTREPPRDVGVHAHGNLHSEQEEARNESCSALLNVTMALFATAGGFMSANVGSGSDMALYVFGTFVWNPLRPRHAINETVLTASSVVVMGLLSLQASVCRALNGGFSRKILLCWGADSFIVVLGAPVGSLVLSPSATRILRRLFYVMAVVQFLNFNVMEEAFYDDRVAPYVGTRVWFVLGPVLLLEVLVLYMHHRRIRREAQLASPSLV